MLKKSILDETINLDYQSTTPVAPGVLQEMLPFFTELAGNPHSSTNAIGWRSSRAVEASATEIARLIGADPDEVVFTSGATEANNLALLGLGRGQRVGSRRRILVSAIEHKCVLSAARALKERHGFEVEELPVDEQGFVCPAELTARLDGHVLLVSVMAVNNEIGTIQDIRTLAARTHEAGAFFHSDAAQAAMAMDLSGIAQDVDLLSLSSHKMYGPQGIGALFMRRSLQNRFEPIIYGGGQQSGLRSGTLPLPLCVGMGAAAKLIGDESTAKARSVLARVRDRLVTSLKALPWGISVNGPRNLSKHPGNASICFHGFDARDILQALQPHLAASTGSACTTGLPEPSHVLRAIGLSSEDADATVRFSLGFETTEEEIDRAIDLVAGVLARLSCDADPAA